MEFEWIFCLLTKNNGAKITQNNQTHYKWLTCIPYSIYHRATLDASQITIILSTQTLTRVFELEGMVCRASCYLFVENIMVIGSWSTTVTMMQVDEKWQL